LSGTAGALSRLWGAPTSGTVSMRITTMGSATDKIKGVANQVGGKVKEGVGKAIGNEQMQVEGMAQQVKGKTQRKVGEVKSTIKDVADKVADKAHEKL
jgi:uncharacterized protein YjbJ (UPF0337 family)